MSLAGSAAPWREDPWNEPAYWYASLADYRRMIRRIPRPSPRQIREAVEFIPEDLRGLAHDEESLLPPGLPIVLYLDPLAGVPCFTERDGTVIVQEDEWTPVEPAEYRRRFGYLTWRVGSGWPPVFDEERQRIFALPTEVETVGEARVSGLLESEATARPECWLQIDEAQTAAWPAETGGPALAREIVERCRAVVERERTPTRNLLRYLSRHEKAVAELLEPERRRQRAAIGRAIERMLGLLGRA
jgi:hypothetical protein